MIRLRINASANDLKSWGVPFISRYDYTKLNNLLMFDKSLTILVNDNESNNDINTYAELEVYLTEALFNDEEFRKILESKGIVICRNEQKDIIKQEKDIYFEINCQDVVEAYKTLNSSRGSYLASVARDEGRLLLITTYDN